MVIEEGLSPNDCVFLDIEVFRNDVKSVGHHMLRYSSKDINGWDAFENCIQPNNIRGYDTYNNFRIKYPLATIHLLIGIIGSKMTIDIPESAICPLLFTDGVFNVLFKYPENVLNWLNFLRVHEKKSPLRNVFENRKYSVFSLMIAMDEFFKKRDEISIPGERGDRLKISSIDSNPYNILKKGSFYEIDFGAKNRIIEFIKILSSLTTWKYKEKSWLWDNLDLYKFTKRDFKKDGKRLNNANFDNLISKNPLSWAITSRGNLEYTLERPDKLQ